MSYIFEFAKSLRASVNAPADFLYDLEVVMNGALKNVALSGVDASDPRIERLAEITDAIQRLRELDIYHRTSKPHNGSDSDDGADTLEAAEETLSTWSMGNATYAGLGQRNANTLSSATALEVMDDTGTTTGSVATTAFIAAFDNTGAAVAEATVEAVQSLFTKCREHEHATRDLAALEQKLAKHEKKKDKDKVAEYRRCVEEATGRLHAATEEAHTALGTLVPTLYANYKARFTRICEDLLSVLNPEVLSESEDGEEDLAADPSATTASTCVKGNRLRTEDSTNSRGLPPSEAEPNREGVLRPLAASSSTPVTNAFPAATGSTGPITRSVPAPPPIPLSADPPSSARSPSASMTRRSGVAPDTSSLNSRATTTATTSRLSAQRHMQLVQEQVSTEKDGVLVELASMSRREAVPQQASFPQPPTGPTENDNVWNSSGSSCVDSAIRRNRRNLNTANRQDPSASAHNDVGNERKETVEESAEYRMVKVTPRETSRPNGSLAPTPPAHTTTDAHGRNVSVVELADVHGDPSTLLTAADDANNSEADVPEPLHRRQLTAAALAEWEHAQQPSSTEEASRLPDPRNPLGAASGARGPTTITPSQDGVSERHNDDHRHHHTAPKHGSKPDDMWFRYYFFDRLKNSAEKVPLLYNLSLDHFQRIARKSGYTLPERVRVDVCRTKDDLQSPQVARRRKAFDNLFHNIFQYRKNLEMLRWKLKLVKEAEAKLRKYGGDVAQVESATRATSPPPPLTTTISLSATESVAASASSLSGFFSRGKRSDTERKRKVNQKKVDKWTAELTARRADVAAWKEEVFVKGAGEMFAFYDALIDILTDVFEGFHTVLREEGASSSYHSGRFHRRKLSFGAAAELLDRENQVFAPET